MFWEILWELTMIFQIAQPLPIVNEQVWSVKESLINTFFHSKATSFAPWHASVSCGFVAPMIRGLVDILLTGMSYQESGYF